MEFPNDIQEYIDRYRAGEISAPDFNKRLASDADLRKEYELHKKDLQIIRSAAREDLKKKATHLLTNVERPPVKTFPIRRAWLVAASLLLLVSTFFIFQKTYQPASPTELFAAHLELPSPANARSTTSETKSWENAMKAYADQNFTGMIAELSPAIDRPDFQYKEQGKLFLGIAHLQINEVGKAIELFDRVSEESSYFQEANWYKALGYLKLEKTEQAKSILKNIANQPKHFKQEAAAEILEEL